MPGTALAVVTSCALRMVAATTTYYEVSIATEARGRYNIAQREGAEATSTGSEFQLAPRLGFALREGSVEVGGGYFPGLRWTEPSGLFAALHRGSLELSWRYTPRSRATAGASASYGTTDLLTQITEGGAAGEPVQPVPRVTTLRYLSAEGSLQVKGPLARQVDGFASAAAFVEGGGDPQARDVLPLQRGIRIAGNVNWKATGDDEFTTAVNGTLSDFSSILAADGTGISSGAQNRILRLSETWHHTLSGGGFRSTGRSVPRWDVWLSAGAAGTDQRREGVSTRDVVLTGEVGVHGKLHIPIVEGSAAVGIAPIIDRISADVYSRANAKVSLSWRPWAEWTLRLGGDGGVVVDGPQTGDKIGTGELRVAWSPSRVWEIGAGARAAWQRQALFGSTSTVQEWTGFLGLEFRERERL